MYIIAHLRNIDRYMTNHLTRYKHSSGKDWQNSVEWQISKETEGILNSYVNWLSELKRRYDDPDSQETPTQLNWDKSCTDNSSFTCYSQARSHDKTNSNLT